VRLLPYLALKLVSRIGAGQSAGTWQTSAALDSGSLSGIGNGGHLRPWPGGHSGRASPGPVSPVWSAALAATCLLPAESAQNPTTVIGSTYEVFAQVNPTFRSLFVPHAAHFSQYPGLRRPPSARLTAWLVDRPTAPSPLEPWPIRTLFVGLA
jgi:hypothetical protein